jgi:hypothetical protein
MALTYHFIVDPPYDFTTDSKETARTKLNANSNIFEYNEQQIENRLEDTLDDLFDAFVISGMVGSINAGTLTFAITSGVALIGTRVVCASGNVTVAASQSTQPIYFCQDGTWTVVTPTTKSYLIWGTYSSDGSEITVLTKTVGTLSLTYSVSITGDLTVTGNTILGNAATDTITNTGRLIVRTLGSDPQDATPGNRPAGSVGEIAYYSTKMYFCTNTATPTWELIVSS